MMIKTGDKLLTEQFINEKIEQLVYYLKAAIKHKVHYTELDTFIWDTLEEWATLNITDETPSNARERVFWHLIHELSLHSARNLDADLYLRSEVTTCIEFLDGHGSYPIDCIGWRPLP